VVYFTPTSVGEKVATLSISHDATNVESPSVIELRGTGVERTVWLSISPTTKTFLTATDYDVSQNFHITNATTGTLEIYNVC